ncbi:restriction endonuclease subunit S [Thiococcus pfennigii]|uniref:restriction endonuclease subunit S n=1 Tax=Thiococcus pfennigii TaxID=1057 RepID=UPI001905611C|nr:restriction endonuclease subunit S [Thiococcus pfennigii]MBK1733575.1 hypothetical protein [Thiococcus pfennigii]
MGEWESVRLEDVCQEITVGHVGPMADKYVDEGIPFLRSLNVEPFRIRTDGLKFIGRDFHKKLSKSSLRPGDVVIVRTGKPGACAVIPDWLEEANCSDLVIVRCGSRLRSRFLSYVVNSIASHHIESHLVGAVQQHFNVGAARSLILELPGVAEQDQIIDLLGSINDKVELNRQTNETLEALARAIFTDWFVDFGPTRAKAEGRPPYLAPELWDLFPDALDDEDKPVGWTLCSFGSLLDSSIGGDWGKEEKDGKYSEFVSIIRGTDFPIFKSGFADKIPQRFVEKNKLDKRRLDEGDIVVEVSGGSPTQPTGRSIYFSSEAFSRFSNPVVPASFCRRFRPQNKAVGLLLAQHLNYLYQGGGTWAYQNQSTGIANFQTKFFLENELVVLPSSSILEAFHDVVRPIFEKAQANENTTLARGCGRKIMYIRKRHDRQTTQSLQAVCPVLSTSFDAAP